MVDLMPVGAMLVFFEGGRYYLKKFDGSAWQIMRELTENQALAMSY